MKKEWEKRWYDYRWDEGTAVIFKHRDFEYRLIEDIDFINQVKAVSNRLADFSFMRRRGI